MFFSVDAGSMGLTCKHVAGCDVVKARLVTLMVVVPDEGRNMVIKPLRNGEVSSW